MVYGLPASKGSYEEVRNEADIDNIKSMMRELELEIENFEIV